MATATEEVVAAGEAAPVVEEVKEAPVVEEEKKAEEEVVVEKKGEGEGDVKVEEKTKKERKPRVRKPRSAGPHHPPYFEMIKEAIMAQDGNGKTTGTSPYAIAKYMGEQHKEELPANYRKVLAVQLRNFAAKGRLVKYSFYGDQGQLSHAGAKRACRVSLN
uniref:H15 domain-containing protein n=1 Tax=Leersia perrieri TaxID=77586 RepID=A0A0D9WLD6_9ORYZ